MTLGMREYIKSIRPVVRMITHTRQLELLRHSAFPKKATTQFALSTEGQMRRGSVGAWTQQKDQL